jgi:molybdopterin/thiamine biosynthesis adenylyltransferase
VADTGELTEDLDLARRALDDLHGEVKTLGPWLPANGTDLGDWYLRLELFPGDLNPAGPIPAITHWFAIASMAYPQGAIDLMPAKDGGITDTFAHQLPNDPGPTGLPWRTGKVCLVDTVRGHDLAAKRDEPATAYERLVWHVWRTLDWLRRASRNELLKAGEPFELPVFGQFRDDGSTIAFHEGAASFARWADPEPTSGLADLVKVTDGAGPGVFAVRRWADLRGRSIMEPVWGSRIESLTIAETALWFRLPRLLVRPPWRAPQSWREVLEFAREQGIDFEAALRQASSAVRDGKPHFVLLGFPVQRIMGEAPSRYAWVAFLLPALTEPRKKGRSAPSFPGFRPELGAWMADRTIGGLANAAVLPWVRSENWHPDELAARGRFDGGLAGRRVALLGAGAFGSLLGELLVRAGVLDLTILDAGRVEAGNLARHALTVTEVGSRKATALAERLSRVSPNARVVGFDQAFPPTGDARTAVDAADLIIDATASESVIDALAAFEWRSEKVFTSVSFSFGAEKLYLYLASGDAFPRAHYRDVLAPWITADQRPPEDFPHEGTGCWSSVFPARADDVALVAAIAARQLDDRTKGTIAEPQLVVYARNADGTVSILDLPPSG